MKRIFAKKQLPAAILAAAMTVSASAGLCSMFPTFSANAEDAPAATVDGGGTPLPVWGRWIRSPWTV